MFSEEERKVLRRLYIEEELSCTAIGKQLGVDGKTVHRWLAEMGIPRRTRSEAASLQWGAKKKILQRGY